MPFKNGDWVEVKIPGTEIFEGIGEVIGIASIAQPIIGSNYIVRITISKPEIPNKTYDFSAVAVPECFLTMLKNQPSK